MQQTAVRARFPYPVIDSDRHSVAKEQRDGKHARGPGGLATLVDFQCDDTCHTVMDRHLSNECRAIARAFQDRVLYTNSLRRRTSR
jgi:hypothetical protein